MGREEGVGGSKWDSEAGDGEARSQMRVQGYEAAVISG